MSGWIKLHRKLVDWEWFNTPNMYHIFSYCLLKANYEEKSWKGIKIIRGSFITSIAKISEDTGVSIQSVRTCLKRLQKTSEINIVTNKLHSIVTVCNYDSYQEEVKQPNKEPNKQLTNNQQTPNKLLTTTKNIKEYKELKEDKKELFLRWFNYRLEIKKPIKTVQGAKLILKKFAINSTEQCKFVINSSIENSYTGLFWDKKIKCKSNKMQVI